MVFEIPVGKDGRATGARYLDAVGAEQEVRARHVVVAAGSVGTPHLLLLSKSGSFPDGLGNGSGQVGKHFTFHHHPSAMALMDEDVLPKVVSGASMGSFVTVIIGSRSRADLQDLFQNLDRLHTTALQMLSPMSMLKDKVVLDSKQLFSCIEANTGSMTFREAYECSGLIINITVSPTRAVVTAVLTLSISDPAAPLAVEEALSSLNPSMDRPAVSLSDGNRPVSIVNSDTAALAPPERLKPSETCARIV